MSKIPWGGKRGGTEKRGVEKKILERESKAGSRCGGLWPFGYDMFVGERESDAIYN